MIIKDEDIKKLSLPKKDFIYVLKKVSAPESSLKPSKTQAFRLLCVCRESKASPKKLLYFEMKAVDMEIEKMHVLSSAH